MPIQCDYRYLCTRVHELYSDCGACVRCIQTIRLLNVGCIQTIRLLNVRCIQTIRLLNVSCIQTIRLVNIRQLAGAASLRLLFGGSFPDINICSTASLVTHSTGARGEASMKGLRSGGHWRIKLTLFVLISTLLQRNILTSAGEFGQGESQLTVDCLCELLLYSIPLAPVSPPFTYQSIRIPQGCSVRGSKVEEEEERVLRQAVCNESPCPCDGSPEGYGECCSVRGEMETVRIHCHHANGTDLSQKVVTSCKCVPCKEKMVGIAGHVISSATSRPVPLASLMIDGKAIGTSDLSGNFAVTFKTTRSFLELTVAEPHHKLGKVGIRPGNQKLTIVLETHLNLLPFHCTTFFKLLPIQGQQGASL